MKLAAPPTSSTFAAALPGGKDPAVAGQERGDEVDLDAISELLDVIEVRPHRDLPVGGLPVRHAEQ